MPLRRKLSWIALLYFAEGFPYGLVKDNLPVYFLVHGISRETIGAMSLLGLPWSLKVFWAPVVDRFGERRQWIAGALAVMALTILLLPLSDPHALDRPVSDVAALALWGTLLCLTIASATQDIAIDAYSIALLDPGEEGVANGIRVAAYRAALIVGGGALVILAGALGWTPLFTAAAVIFTTLAVVVRRSPPVRIVRQPTAEWTRAFLAWLTRPGAPFVLLFVLIYKLGDISMGPMVKPFWVDRGLSVSEIGFVSTTLGVGATVVGALAGGVFTSRFGIFRGLWALGLLQALSNLGYALAAAEGGTRPVIYAASLMESFTAGLGTAAFLAFLMHVCEREQAATQFALLSALFSLPGTFAGALSGRAVSWLGFSSYFALTFLLALPAFALLPWVRGWIHDRPAEAAATRP